MSLTRSRPAWFGAGAILICGAILSFALAAWRSQEQAERVARAITGGNPKSAPDIIRRYGCGGCHNIPGIVGADGQVGPPLSDLIHRLYIGGVVTNSPDHLVRWIVSPQSFSPGSVMPASGISESEARDVAAYLYSK